MCRLRRPDGALGTRRETADRKICCASLPSWLNATVPELTATELRVAELAAGGMTNREVAAAAFMTPKTVEANLARVYRKFGIRSRAQLGARIAAERGDIRPRT